MIHYVPNRALTKSASKLDALQTHRDCRDVSTMRQRLEGAEIAPAFPRSVHGAAWERLWKKNIAIGPTTARPQSFSPLRGQGSGTDWQLYSHPKKRLTRAGESANNNRDVEAIPPPERPCVKKANNYQPVILAV